MGSLLAGVLQSEEEGMALDAYFCGCINTLYFSALKFASLSSAIDLTNPDLQDEKQLNRSRKVLNQSPSAQQCPM